LAESPDLNRIASDLNNDRSEILEESSATLQLDRWLAALVQQGGSDLLLVPNAPPCLRFEGHVRKLESGSLDGTEIEAAVLPALTSHALQLYRSTQIADSSYRVAGLGRFRINLHRERGSAAAAVRALPAKVPSLHGLRLPPSVEALAHLPRGLVLIGGPAGSGKTTTLAALVNQINHHESRHILTIEDPIEYEHTHIRSIVEQVEIGTDAPDFPTALRAALRQAPDVLVVGEMRDPETMQIAVAAAETGHLVLSTLHTTDVASTISRVSDSFPVERQNTIRQELAMALAAVLTQILVPVKGGGQMPVTELLMIGYAARQHIRHNALQYLRQEITLTKRKGSLSLEESLGQLISQGHLSREDAAALAFHPEELESLLKSEPRSNSA